MNGINIKFKCKSCNKEQEHTVSGTLIYEINEIKNITYVPLECYKCNKAHFISDNGVIVESMSEKDIEKAYEKKIKENFGSNIDYREIREYMDGKLNFILEDKAVISIDEVTHKKQKGSVMY